MSEQSRRPCPRAVGEADLNKDLAKFREKAVEFGASAAEVIPASHVVVDERVWMKCLVPRCRGLRYGGTPHCPPNTPQPEFMRKVLSHYRWAVLFRRDIKNLADYVPTSETADREFARRPVGKDNFHEKTFEIVGRLESYAQGEGYYLAMGFSGGSCRVALCHGATCGVIENGTCRFPLQARPSMEGVGIDVFDLARKVGWDVYMIRRVEPDLGAIPCGVSIGVVFIC